MWVFAVAAVKISNILQICHNIHTFIVTRVTLKKKKYIFAAPGTLFFFWQIHSKRTNSKVNVSSHLYISVCELSVLRSCDRRKESRGTEWKIENYWNIQNYSMHFRVGEYRIEKAINCLCTYVHHPRQMNWAFLFLN